MSQNEASARDTISLQHIKISILLALGLVHILVTLFFIVPGYLSIDEVVYDLSTKSFSQTGGFEVRNGYRELPSPEMHHEFFPPHNGRLVAQYPYLFSVLATPMYLIAGFYGLFVVNAIAFVGVVLLCYGIANRLLRDRNLALNACLILVLCTFAWEYSQAAWPHMTSVLFISAAIYCAVRSYIAETKREALRWAVGAGLAAGLGPSIRMEAALLPPALLLPFLFARPWRPAEALAIVAGTLPGLAAFGFANYEKFGGLSPFSYGGPIIISPWLIAAILGLLILGWVITRTPWQGALEKHRIKLFWAAAAALAGLLVVPQARSFLLYMWGNFWVSVGDVRSLDASLILPAMTRSSGGGVVYIGAQKKALLQSLPFLVVLVAPIARVLRGEEDYPALLILLLLPITVIGYYAYAFYYSGGLAGGLCLNYRYALPILPLLAILAAYGIERMKDRWGRPLTFRNAAILCFLTALVYFLFVRRLSSSLNDLEFPLLDIPLFIAGALFVVLLVGEIVQGDVMRVLRPVVWAILIIALAWSSLVAFFYDFPKHREQRARNYYTGGAVRRVVAPSSIFFTFPVIDPFMRVIENRHVGLAFPGRDHFKDFPRLVSGHLAAGRRVYGAFYNATWNRLKAGPLAKYTLIPRLEPMPGFMIAEITLPRSSRSSETKGAR
jgi:4-amino-4-deoxy-L-arabinose transferase-like glycosyltransferase